MSKLSRTTALALISDWSTDDVIEVLKKNALEDCCQAVLKRQIDGDELLHLTTGKLALWKSDLSRDQIWTLWNFVESIVRSPEDYVSPPSRTAPDEPMSDSGSWGSDFDDHEEHPEEARAAPHHAKPSTERNANFRNSLALFELNGKPPTRKTSLKSPDTPESIYMNCPSDEEDTTYINVEPQKLPPPRTISQFSSKLENCLAEKLKEELKLIIQKENSTEKKPEIAPRPTLAASNISRRPQMTNPIPKQIIKKPLPPPGTPKKFPKVPDRPDELPRPPKMLRNFDLVANLPTKAEESDDDYEAIDSQVALQHQHTFGSKQSMLGSVESVYKPSSSTTSQEKEDDFYECITEAPDDNVYYVQPIIPPSISTGPPPLPSKPITPGDAPAPTNPRKMSLQHERPPEKKQSPLHHSGSNSSLSEMRATRPLPPPPDRLTYVDQSWFHSITREQANAVIRERPHNGYFLLRPSNTNPNNPFVLTLWFNDGVYNVQVRKRPDSRYALGSPRAQEQSFASVEEIVQFHSREELPLCRGRVQTGSTLLTDTPPKRLNP
ncbi:lymphocyte cytosolic protein 2 [Fopius arisanus]|uniref:Lymphocyte cytosolic protein 2 n=1 Tax=Fopius arisanus TaxID=64838 RepID=A0A9R1TTR3_9HYME|nr:PREDICTED: lymphocyte cytosolic protein 2-like [Fopius arisanus]